MDKKEKEYLIIGSNYIKKLLTDSINVKFRLRNDDTKSYLNLIDIIDGVNMLINLILKTKGSHSIVLDLEKIKELFFEIEGGIQNSDSNLIADVLEYEIAPLLESWDQTLNIELR